MSAMRPSYPATSPPGSPRPDRRLTRTGSGDLCLVTSGQAERDSQRRCCMTETGFGPPDDPDQLGEMAESVAPLGSIGEVECIAIRTERPWTLDIDAIVVSVGETLGGLGMAIRAEFPDAGWDLIDFSTITPEYPRLLNLGRRRRFSTLQRAVLATPH